MSVVCPRCQHKTYLGWACKVKGCFCPCSYFCTGNIPIVNLNDAVNEAVNDIDEDMKPIRRINLRRSDK